MLLTIDFMSSESSADESENEDESVRRSVLRVKKIAWLKKKYRDAFHQIDKSYYAAHKKSRDKLKRRIPGGNSQRQPHDDTPKSAIKAEFRGPHQESGGDLTDSELSGDIAPEFNDSSSSFPSVSECTSSSLDMSPSISSPRSTPIENL